MVLKFILIGGVLPGALCAVALLVTCLVFRAGGRFKIPPSVFPILLALSILPAEVLAHGGWPRLLHWPKNAGDRILHTTIVAGIAGSLIGLVSHLLASRRRAALIRPAPSCDGSLALNSRLSLGATLLLSAPTCAATFWMFLSYRMAGHWKSAATAAAWIAVFVLVAIVMIAALELASRRRRIIDTARAAPSRDPAPVAVAFIAANALPLVILDSGNAYISQLCGGVVAAIGAALVAAALIPGFSLARGGNTAVVAALATMGLAGFYFGDDPEPLIPMLLIAAAPLVAGLTLCLFLSAADMWKRLLVGGAIAALLAGSAVAVQFAATPEAPADSSGADDPYQLQ
ncbi:MAG: hypothetical protein AB7G11_01355 [Phycisphaerales bacterium]